jgi:predicted GNAT superfamily acetyltransferase
MKKDYKVILVSPHRGKATEKLEDLLNKGYKVVEMVRINQEDLLYTLQRKRLF